MEEFAAKLPEHKKTILAEVMHCWDDMMENTVYQITEWKGHKFMPGFFADTAEYLYEEWNGPNEGDVVVAAFPKTGTNWLHEIVRQILYNSNEEHEKISMTIPPPLTGLEIGPACKYQLWEHINLPRRVFFTHLPYELFNDDKFTSRKAKIIYIARNPKDQLVSYFHFVKNFPCINDETVADRFSDNWEDFFLNGVKGTMYLETKEGEWYLEHLLGWYKSVVEDENKMFIFYEDMKKDFPWAIRKISDFLGIVLSEQEVGKIATSCGIHNMKERSKEGIKAWQGKIQIVRKGAVGDWKNYFTVAQSEMMDEMVEKKIGHLNIKFIYEL